MKVLPLCSSAICIFATIALVERIGGVDGLLAKNHRGRPLQLSSNQLPGSLFTRRFGTTTSNTNSREESTHAFQRDDAVKAFRSCAMVALVSGLLDAAVTISPMLLQKGSFSTAAVAVPTIMTLWKLGFSACSLHVGTVYKRIDNLYVKANTNDEKILAELCETMNIFWLTTAWVLVVTVSAEVLSFVSNNTKHRSIALRAIAVVVASISVVLRGVSVRPTSALTTTDGEKKPSLVRRVGHRNIRNMAFCAAALIGKGVVAAVLLVLRKNQLFTLLGLPTPFITAGLLWQLRSRFLDALLEATDSNSRTTNSDESTTFSKLYHAQTVFYSKVASTLEHEIKSKVVLVLVTTGKTFLGPLAIALKSTIKNA